MTMKSILPVCLLTVTVLSAAPARSEPSFRGYSGLLKIPTTDTLGPRQYNLGVNTIEAEGFDDPSYLANFGIADDFEAGILWFHPDGGGNETLINLKYRFQPGGDGRPSFAVGITDVMDEVDTGLYAVGTWELGDLVARVENQDVKRIRLHAGLGGGAIDDFFFGAEARFGPHFIVMADHMNDEFSIGARARLWRNFTAQAGLLDMDDLAIAVTYTYPMSEAGTLAPVIVDEKPGAEPAKAPPQAMVPRVKPRAEPEPETPAVGAPEPGVEEQAGTTQPESAPDAEASAEPPSPAPDERQAEEPESPPVIVTTPEAPRDEEAATTPAEPEEPQPVTQPPPPEEATTPSADDQPSPEEEEPAPEELKVDHSKAVVPIPLDGLPVEVEGGHVSVPARQVATWLGFRVDAQPDRRGIKVTIHAGLEGASFYIGDDRVEVNGERVELGTPTYYLNQRIAMVPVELFKLLGVPTEIDMDGGRALLERHDAVGVVTWGK